MEDKNKDMIGGNIETPSRNDRLAVIMERRSSAIVDVPRRMLLGFTKLALMVGVMFSFYSFLYHGKDNTQLSRSEIRDYIISFILLGFLGGIFEVTMRFFPRWEVSLLPVWNAFIQGLDNMALKFLLIFDSNCEEVDQPLCNKYNTLVIYLLVAAAPIVILSSVSMVQEYLKYNSLKQYIKTGDIDTRTNFIKKPLIRQLSFGVDTGLAAISLATHLMKTISMYELFFAGKVRGIANSIEWYVKIVSAAVGFLIGIIVDKFFKSASKKVFCINEFFQSLLLNGYGSGITYVLSLIYFDPKYRSGINNIKEDELGKIMLFVIFGGIGLLPLIYSAVRVHDEYQFKFLTRITYKENNDSNTKSLISRICCFWKREITDLPKIDDGALIRSEKEPLILKIKNVKK